MHYIAALVILFSASFAHAQNERADAADAVDMLNQANKIVKAINRPTPQPGQMGRTEDIEPKGNFNDDESEKEFLDGFDDFMKRDDFGKKPAAAGTQAAPVAPAPDDTRRAD